MNAVLSLVSRQGATHADTLAGRDWYLMPERFGTLLPRYRAASTEGPDTHVRF